MSVRLMTQVYAAHFHDITFVHKGRKKGTGEEYEKIITVLNSNLKSVCLALADHANDEGEGSYPAIESLVHKTELSEVTIVACLKAMKQDEIITYTGRSKWKTCTYTINKDKLTAMAGWDRQKRGKVKTKATLVLKLKPLKFKTKAALVKPSIHPKPPLIISEAVAQVFTDAFGKFYSQKEQTRWATLYEASGQSKTDDLIAWALRKEIHLMNRPSLLDSLETAAAGWQERPAKTNGKKAVDLNSLFSQAMEDAANEQT